MNGFMSDKNKEGLLRFVAGIFGTWFLVAGFFLVGECGLRVLAWEAVGNWEFWVKLGGGLGAGAFGGDLLGELAKKKR